MTEIFADYGLFLAKTITLTVFAFILLNGFLAILSKGKSWKKDKIEIKSLNAKYENMVSGLEREMLPKHLRKKYMKRRKAAEKRKKKSDPPSKKRLFILDFKGDIRASANESLRKEITAVLSVAKDEDEVLLRLESGGGMVHSYGLAASQLLRLKGKVASLTVAVDKIAASGGYLMAAAGDRIIAAPFAVIGSIGVVAQLPNFNRLLKKHDIDFEQITAGEHKRTLTLFGENTEEDREKLKRETEDVHQLFKDFLRRNRRELDIEKVSTGEHWHALNALPLKLVDQIATSDDYILARTEKADIFEISCRERKSFREKMSFFGKP